MQKACQGTIPLQRPAGWQTEGEEKSTHGDGLDLFCLQRNSVPDEPFAKDLPEVILMRPPLAKHLSPC